MLTPTKPKFTNSPADKFSKYSDELSRYTKDYQSKSKEEQQKVKVDLLTQKYASQKLTGMIQETNKNNKFLMETGSNPTDVLWWSASALAMKAKETNDPRLLDLITKIETKSGNYGQTLKGKKLIYDTYKEIQSNLNSENLADARAQEGALKEEKHQFRVKGGTLYQQYRANPNEVNTAAWKNFSQKETIEKGFDDITKDVILNVDNIMDTTEKKPIEDGDFIKMSVKMLSDNNLTEIEMSNDPENLTQEIISNLVEDGYDITSEQQTLLNKEIKSIVSVEGLAFVKDNTDSAVKMIEGHYDIFSKSDGDPDVYKSPLMIRAETEAIMDFKDRSRRLWMDMLNKAKKDSGGKVYIGITEWSSELQNEFKERLNDLGKEAATGYNDRLKKAYDAGRAPNVRPSAEKVLERVLDELYYLGKYIDSDSLPTLTHAQRYLGGEEFKSTKEMKERVATLQHLVKKRYPEKWKSVSESMKTVEEEDNKLSINRPKNLEHEKYAKELEEIIIKGASESPESLEINIQSYLKTLPKDIALDESSKAGLKAMSDSLKVYREVPQLADSMKRLETKLRITFPRWQMGKLEKGLMIFNMRSTPPLTTAQAALVNKKQQEVHTIVKEELISHTIASGKGYLAFSNTQKDAFEDTINSRLEKALSETEMLKLNGGEKKQEVSTIDQAKSILKSASPNGIVDSNMLKQGDADSVEKGIELIENMGETSTNDAYKSLGLTGATTQDEKKNAIAVEYYLLMGLKLEEN